MKDWIIIFACLILLCLIMYIFICITAAIIWFAMQIMMLGEGGLL